MKNQRHLKILVMGFNPLIKSMEQVLEKHKPAGDEDPEDSSAGYEK